MSFRSALARNVTSLQPEYVRTAPVGGRDAVFRFSVPVLRVRDVAATVAWYKRHLGFAAEAFPERAPHEFAILGGTLVPGTRLPSSRALADDLSVSRTTTLLAYEQLLAEGYLAARRGSGTFVAD